MTIQLGDRALPGRREGLTGYLAWADGRRGRRPGVLVVHGGAGLDDHARGRARRMAGLGYVAFACDMYGDGVPGDRERIMRPSPPFEPTAPGWRRGSRRSRMLTSHPDVDGRIAAVGYCFGGMTVLETAREGAALAGVVSVHGTLDTPRPPRPARCARRCWSCHGALDPHVPTAQVTVFADEMRDAGADWQLIVYGGAMHGFTHEHADGSGRRASRTTRLATRDRHGHSRVPRRGVRRASTRKEPVRDRFFFFFFKFHDIPLPRQCYRPYRAVRGARQPVRRRHADRRGQRPRFLHLARRSPWHIDEIAAQLGFQRRPIDVMTTLFVAMGLLERDGAKLRPRRRRASTWSRTHAGISVRITRRSPTGRSRAT